MAVVVAFARSANRALTELESESNPGPVESSFVFPDEARANDVAVYYIGGRLEQYVAIGRILTNWRRAGAGAWKGYDYVSTSMPHLLAEFQPGTAVAAQCGFPAPREGCVVPSRVARDVVRMLRGKPVDVIDRAVEGAATEARSRQRNTSLREAARRNADGICAVCRTDFKGVARGRGMRCLVVHHTQQLKDYDQPRETKLSDLAVVCANCHMLIHSDPHHALTVREARALHAAR